MAVDVGSAQGYLDIDISRFVSGLRTAQSEATTQSKNIAESMSRGLQSAGESMTKVGRMFTAGVTAPIATGVATAVKQFANLEQSIGGIETLFKNSASTVIASAETAYTRAGLDANAYMEQVTSFSATLLQGLGGDTATAAKVADKAIVDMSDNANKMGTNIGLIQNAYQGFAKDNYTMLDNLKLGYGGTASEMARLVNDSGVMGDSFEATAENVKDIPFDQLIESIHKTQEGLGITGTTAKEATATVSGSFQQAKSSVLNFFQQLGNPGADMDKFAQEMLKSVGVFVDNVKRVLSTIWDNLPISPLQKKLLVAAAAFGPVMFAGGKVVSTVGSIVTGIDKAIPLISQFATGFASAGAPLAAGSSSMTAFGAAIGVAIGPILAIVAVIATLVAAFKHLWETNEEFRNKITGIWDGIKQKFEEFGQGIVDRLNALGFDFENFTEVVGVIWDAFCNLLAPVFEGVFSQISNIIGTILDIITGILDVFIGLFTGNWDQLWTGVKEIFDAAWNFVKETFQNWANAFKGIADVVLGWFCTTWDDTWNAIKQFFVDTWNAIINFFVNIGTTMTTAVANFITAIINFFAKLPTNIANFITNAFNAVVIWASNMVAKASEMGANFLNAVVEFFTQLPGKVLQFITSALQNVKTWATNMATQARAAGTNFINNVVSFLMHLPGKVKQFLDSAINNCNTWVTQMGQKGREAIAQLISNIVSAATSIPGKMAEIGKNIVQGVWNGIKNAASWFTNQIKGFFTGIVDGVKGALKIGSPSKVFRDEVGKWLPAGIAVGFKEAMPAAMKSIQSSLDDGIEDLSTDDIKVDADANVTSFADKIKSIYENVAVWFESIDTRLAKSIDGMIRSLNMLINAGQIIVNSDGTLGYVSYNGFTPLGTPQPVDSAGGGNDSSGDGDTYNFYSPKAIDEIEAAKQMKKTKRDIAEGF